jgi:oligosaccharide repeat unit polymerase
MILNPSLLYSLLWISLTILYSLKLSNILLPLDTYTLSFILLTVFMFIFGWIACCYRDNKLLIRPIINIKLYKSWAFSKKVSLNLRIFSIIFVLGYLITIQLAGNIPLLSLFGIGKPVLYTEFGISGIHGLFNALYLVVCNIIFLRHILCPNKKRIIILLILFCWPILAVTRQLFISLALELFFTYALIFRETLLGYFKSWKLWLAMFGLLYAFEYVSNLRSAREHIIFLSSPVFEYPDYLPSTPIWFYMYVTSPLNNLINNLSTISPNYLPVETISGLIPSFLREIFYTVIGYTPPTWTLVDRAFNVSSMHQKFLSDFGFWITQILYFLVSYFSSVLLKNSISKPKYGLALVVVLHGLALSFFDDLLFHLVFVAQLFIYLRLL